MLLVLLCRGHMNRAEKADALKRKSFLVLGTASAVKHTVMWDRRR